MRAIVMDAYGGPEVLRLGERPVPTVGPDELLVRVTACGVCGHDLLARRGELGTPLPAVLGHEIAGVVEEAGPAVRGLARGQRVALVQRVPCGRCDDCSAGATNMCRRGPGFYGDDLDGGYAEYVLATERNAVAIPDEIDDVTAAILSCGVGTGLRALRAARVGADDVVVVTGAGGGVGVHAVQLAARLGATVVARTGSPGKEQALRGYGAAEVVVGGGAAELRAVVEDLGRPRGADAVIELAGRPTFAASLRTLAPGGRLVLVGNTEPATLGLDPGLTILKELAVIGSAHATRADLEEVVGLVRAGTIAPVAAQVWPLAEADAAHRAVESRSVPGRAVLVAA